jgi:uncharacterized RDD family membrane protein YckC
MLSHHASDAGRVNMLQWLKRAGSKICALFIDDLITWAITWISIALIVLFALATSPFLSPGLWALVNGIFVICTLIGVSFAFSHLPWGRKSSRSE